MASTVEQTPGTNGGCARTLLNVTETVKNKARSIFFLVIFFLKFLKILKFIIKIFSLK
jgi:hypothetical protein